MTRSLRASWIALHLTLIAPAIAVAQSSPWTVTISPSANPQPIGLCGYVYLTVFDPATKDTPRRPNGVRVSMADFDMTVATPDGRSAIGQYASAYAWSVCGCRGATPGTVATITASYPAQALKSELRVP